VRVYVNNCAKAINNPLHLQYIGRSRTKRDRKEIKDEITKAFKTQGRVDECICLRSFWQKNRRKRSLVKSRIRWQNNGKFFFCVWLSSMILKRTGIGVIAPCFPYVGKKWRRVFNSTFRPHYTRGGNPCIHSLVRRLFGPHGQFKRCGNKDKPLAPIANSTPVRNIKQKLS
jgi:hypothetical protein